MTTAPRNANAANAGLRGNLAPDLDVVAAKGSGTGDRRIRPRHLIVAATFIGGLFVPAIAAAASAYTTDDVNMRAGPETGFPRIVTLPAGAAVTVYGCSYGWSWCDTGWRGLRGWVSARYLDYSYEGRRVYLPDYGDALGLPIVTFRFEAYWDRWYSDRPWYRERDRWYSAWMDNGLDDRYERRSRSAAADVGRRSSLRSPSRDLPPGIAKKGRNFCPPGQAKKGRC